MTLTARTQLRRIPERGSREMANVWDILAEGSIAAVGFSIDGQPFVIPMLYGSDRELIYLHGSAASRLMRQLETGLAACLTVTLIDGIVMARSAFNHSMNYRSVVAFGTAKKITDAAQKESALRTISEHVAPGRWAEVRCPSQKELKATTVLAFYVEEASAKVRTGPPSDDDADYALNIWAGVLPLHITAGDPIADPKLRDAIELPQSIRNFETRQLKPRSKS